MSPESIITEFKYRVSYDFQAAIVTEINIISVYELAQKCILIDQNLQQVQTAKAKINRNKLASPTRTSSRAITVTVTLTVQPISITRGYESNIYVNKPRTPHPDPKIERFILTGAYFVCQETSHVAKDCPENTHAKAAKIQEVAGGSDSESEN
jgi:hypothetical protein